MKYLSLHAVGLFLIGFIIIFLLAPEPTHFDYYARLSDAFVNGRPYLTEAPHWLNELIPAGSNRYYVPYPPLPAILLIPFTLLAISNPQPLLAHMLGGMNLALVYLFTRKLTHRLSLPAKKDLFLAAALFLTLSTPHLFLASVGSAWYLAQITGVTLTLAAALAALNKKRFLAGLLLSAAYLARLPMILSAPLIIYLSLETFPDSVIAFVKKIAPFVLGLSVGILINGAYNYARFGTPLDIGYRLIPGVLDEPWYDKGIFHPSYIRNHLEVIFTSLPERLDSFPYLKPRFTGLAIWITTPALIVFAFARRPTRLTLLAWLTFFISLVPSLFHGTTGFSQFGYRFMLDAALPLTVLFVLGTRKHRRLAWTLLTIGIAINIWGTILINKLNAWY